MSGALRAFLSNLPTASPLLGGFDLPSSRNQAGQGAAHRKDGVRDAKPRLASCHPMITATHSQGATKTHGGKSQEPRGPTVP